MRLTATPGVRSHLVPQQHPPPFAVGAGRVPDQILQAVGVGNVVEALLGGGSAGGEQPDVAVAKEAGEEGAGPAAPEEALGRAAAVSAGGLVAQGGAAALAEAGSAVLAVAQSRQGRAVIGGPGRVRPAARAPAPAGR